MGEFISPSQIAKGQSRLMREIYSTRYIGEKCHSPEKSRNSLARRLKPHMSELSKEDVVLDLGSGRQVFEMAHFGRATPDSPRIFTIDIANFQRHQLLARDRRNIQHVTADGANLPFASDTFVIAYSNMGIDLMPEKAIEELYRVVKPGAHVFINVEHPKIVDSKLEELSSQRFSHKKRVNKSIDIARSFWRHYKQTNNRVLERMIEAGFQPIRISEVDDGYEGWFEFDMTKEVTPTQQKRELTLWEAA